MPFVPDKIQPRKRGLQKTGDKPTQTNVQDLLPKNIGSSELGFDPFKSTGGDFKVSPELSPDIEKQGIKGAKIKGITVDKPQRDEEIAVSRAAALANVAIQKEIGTQTGKASALLDGQFFGALNKLSNTADAFRDLVKKEGAGRVGGLLRKTITGPLGVNEVSRSYKGLMTEVATSLAKVAAGTNRPAFELIQQFKETLPDQFSNWQEFGDQIFRSFNNAISSKAALKKIFLSPNQFRDVTSTILNEKILKEVMPPAEFKRWKNRNLKDANRGLKESSTEDLLKQLAGE